MKKRFPAMFLALVLCIGLAIPAFAAEETQLPESYTEAFKDVTVSHTLGGGHVGGVTSVAWLDEEWTRVEYEFDDEGDTSKVTFDETGYRAVRNDTVFTVSRAAGQADDTSYVMVYVTPYVNVGDGKYEWYEWPHSMYLTEEGFVLDMMDPDGFGGLVELKAGESVQFELPGVYDDEETELTDVVYAVRVEKYYPDFTEEKTDEDGNTYPSIPGFYRYNYYKVDEDCVDETVAGLPFDDVRLGVYYDLPVIWAVGNEITKGTSPAAFSPSQTCTQAQILTFLWRAAGEQEVEGELSIEVAEAYRGAILWAADQGMIDLDGFDPEKACTRATAVSYIWQAFEGPEAEAADFTDVDAEADYAAAVSWAVENGVTNGTSETEFSPDQVCTRGQIVTFLYRAYQE